jgi:hypothetical protein
VGKAYGVQFHLGVSAAMADEWSRVPAYAASLERTQGSDALPRLLAEFEEHRPTMSSNARVLFERWLDTHSPDG